MGRSRDSSRPAGDGMSDDEFWGTAPHSPSGSTRSPSDDDLFGDTPAAPPPADAPSSRRPWWPYALGGAVAGALIVGAVVIVGGAGDDAPAPPVVASPTTSAPTEPAEPSPTEATEATTTPTPEPAPEPSATTPATPNTGAAWLAVLDTVDVAPEGTSSGYDRDRYGDGWSDTDGNGCDTRNDVLARDLDDVEMRDACLVENGWLDDPYSGERTYFERGWETSALVQIDHVVPMAESWRSGAAAWTDAEREAFSNDPLNLLAVDGELNQQKQADDVAEWLPPYEGSRCGYAAQMVAVKSTYGLTVDAAERDALAEILGGCGETVLLTGTAWPLTE
ncbi:Protein of unknown function [Paraoerskovia marina]|uniref:GmrSD restriction endonucleases C-terminal domain-containing protein n=1 Tax=Paraoerskovia marina TaxID=545619 RepID=A0A1H1NVI6_9CELL|nr:HNH endonuclease family protein [Paraoerskovia marina]SDS02967.1 Protein of unknown function [Paraoerskovia marina]